MGKRIHFLDNLRTGLILLVIVYSCTALFQDVPAFAAFTSWAQAFTLALLFFISGYFGASSLRIRQFKPFFKEKWRRIGWVWLAGSIILAPQLAYITSTSDDFLSFYMHHFWTDSFSQGPFWFLSLLLAFYVLLMGAKKVRPHCLQYAKEKSTSGLILIVLIIANSAWRYSLGGALRQAWVHPLYILDFPLGDVGTYGLYFLFGIFAFRHRWFTAKGPTPSPLWFLAFAAASVCYLIDPIAPAADVLALTALVGLTGAAARWLNQDGKQALTWAAISYPLYVVSQTLLLNTAWFVQLLDVGSSLKFILVCGLTLIYGYMLSKYLVLRIAPFKRKD